MSRVKLTLIEKCELGWMSTQGQKLHKTKMGKYEQRVTYSIIECCGSYGQLPAERMNVKKGLLISKQNRK
jgi:hypothetical protein